MILSNNIIIHKEDYSSPEARSLFNTAINDDKILNITRLGGCDFEIAKIYYAAPQRFEDKIFYDEKLLEAKNFPGYFDFENKKENFMLYAEKLVTYFKDCDFATYAGGPLLNKIEKDSYTPEDIAFLNYILANKSIMTYGFIESIRPFLNSFKIWGEGKRILVVSPLSKSIEFQYQRKNKIMRNYTYPNFELLTLNTNLTWQHPDDTKEKLGLKTNNWHEECDRLDEEISKLDFDIAWLSCGSYAMHLGHFIKNQMHKKSIYIGGVLNQLFSIYGERYHVYYSSPYNANPKYVLNPFENEDVKKITAGREYKSESVNAYFGYKTLTQSDPINSIICTADLTSINLSLSTLCSANCMFCPSDKTEGSVLKIMPFETAKKIIDEVAETTLSTTVNQILVSENGDPLTNPDFIKILRYIKSRLPKVSVGLFSNFFLMTKELSEILLTEKLIDSIYVNIDSVVENSYKQLKGLNLKTVLENFKTFVTIRNSTYQSLPIGIIIIPLKPYIEASVARLGVFPIKLNLSACKKIENDGERTKEYLLKEFPLQANDNITISKVMLWAERKNVNSEHRKGKCVNINRIINEAFISPDGDWYICCFDSAHNIKLGNIHESSIIEIARSEERGVIIQLLTEEKFDEVGYPCTTSICCEIS